MATEIKFKTLKSNIIHTVEIVKSNTGYFELVCFDTESGHQQSNILINKKDVESILDFMNENGDQ
tara:strand:+ start:106 stop:300 length:195 start_codon:yes stop_codon:yes gene_type:complete